MNKYLKLGVFGFVSWIVPFVTAFLFYSQEGQLLVDVSFFKSVMAVVGSATGAVLLVMYFSKVLYEIPNPAFYYREKFKYN